MKRMLPYLASFLLLAEPLWGNEEPLFKSMKDKVSYILGVSSANNLKKQSLDIDPDIMARGLRDSLSGGRLLMTDQEMREVMTSLRQELAIKEMEQREVRQAEKNKREGEAFLAKNKASDKVVTLPSGLQYRILREGKGKSPKPADTVTVHYRGTHLNGDEFDSSYRRNTPVTIKLSFVIKGWKQALPLMKEGAKWELYIPPDLAYGEKGEGPVEPNATLIYEVELLKVNPDSGLSTPTGKQGTKAPRPGREKP